MKAWLISDTHGKHGQLEVPEGIDLILHAGDAGTYKNPHMCSIDYKNFLAWYGSIDVKYKVMINGNHCTAFEQGVVTREDIPDSVIYLEDESVEIEGLKIYGSPQTPWFYDWAYNVRPEEIGKYWDAIPDDTDILITHGPPHNILDRCADGYRAGCPILADRVKAVQPKIHLFGHIHEDGGKIEEHGVTKYINAAVLNLSYNKANNGIIINLN